ncbi:hypothetical protein TNCV_1144921 [Trichonephila clavipes]|nr:hypothetical protein TNCV_1144921 [Trichonephila clavipes]
MHVKSVKTRCPPVDVVWKFKEWKSSSHVLFSSVHRSSKLRGPPPAALAVSQGVVAPSRGGSRYQIGCEILP